MNSFADSATSLITSRPDAETRRRAWSMFEAAGLPSTLDEVWRYAPLSDFDLDRYRVPTAPVDAPLAPFATSLAGLSSCVVRVADGYRVVDGTDVKGVTIDEAPSSLAFGGDDPFERYASDTFALLNTALAPGTTVVSVEPGVIVHEPIIIIHSAHATSSFPRTQVRLGTGSSATVIEYYDGGDGAVVVPVSELEVGPNASLRLVTYQRLAATAWHVARTTAILDRDARLNQSVLGMGANYNRSRNDADLRASGAQNELRTTFLGSGVQVHDFRTRQYHRGARTRSTLLAKGAVAESSRSVYTGLIEIEKGAKKTDARQTNHNLLLSPFAHADSVPNLDIRENDVVCAHASSVGPLDELQRWYLESRGVERHDAERLMIQGFFLEMLDALPSSVARLVEDDVASVLRSVAVIA